MGNLRLFPGRRAFSPTVCCLTLYDEEIQAPVLSRRKRQWNILGQYLSDHGLKQLRIAETEKYAHGPTFSTGEETPSPEKSGF